MSKNDCTEDIAKAGDWLPAILCMVFSFLFLLTITFSPNGKSELAVIFPFNNDADAVYAKTVNAGAYAIGKGGLDNIIHITIDDQNRIEETITRLYENGALLIINGSAAGACFS